MYQQQGQWVLPEQDQAYTVLADLKRTVREYATAATESSCEQIRQVFTNLLNSSLQQQGQLFKVMEQLNMYSTSSPALRQELDKQIKQNQQTQQQTNQFLQQVQTNQQNDNRIQQQFQAQQNQQIAPYQQHQQFQPYQQQSQHPINQTQHGQNIYS